jgi:large subunit ribosomal protein L15
MLTLKNLKSPKGATRNTKRIGRGEGSGQGKQAGKGHKGQTARSGGGIALGFEGGQMPLYRRLPKRGFKNEPFKKEFAIINLSQLEEKFKDGDVNRDSLVKAGLLSGRNKNLPIKILAKGDFTKKLTFTGIAKISVKAEEVIVKNGGKIVK